jgi:hypothetical protein
MATTSTKLLEERINALQETVSRLEGQLVDTVRRLGSQKNDNIEQVRRLSEDVNRLTVEVNSIKTAVQTARATQGASNYTNSINKVGYE